MTLRDTGIKSISSLARYYKFARQVPHRNTLELLTKKKPLNYHTYTAPKIYTCYNKLLLTLLVSYGQGTLFEAIINDHRH